MSLCVESSSNSSIVLYNHRTGKDVYVQVGYIPRCKTLDLGISPKSRHLGNDYPNIPPNCRGTGMKNYFIMKNRKELVFHYVEGTCVCKKRSAYVGVVNVPKEN